MKLEDREPRTVMVSQIDLWAIQKAIKFNTFMLDPRNMRPAFPSTVWVQANGKDFYIHTAWKLRDKVNQLLIRFATEKLTELEMLPLDLDECWMVDNIINAESYNSAKVLLVQVFQCIWEHENGVSLRTGPMDAEMTTDQKLELIQYLRANETEYQSPPPDEGEGNGRPIA